jgi:hypothetical protein
MKSFFQNFNLARGIILASVLGSLGLGVLGYTQQSRVSELANAFEKRSDRKVAGGTYEENEVTKLAREIESLGRRLDQLGKAQRAEGFSEQEGLQLYAQKALDADGVDIGENDKTPSEVPVDRGNIIDKKIMIKPVPSDRTFPRSKISNLLYKLETDSRRIRVTHVKIALGGKPLPKLHEVPEENNWTFEAQITSRQRKSP